MTVSVYVRTPCRLHFGMFSFGHANRPQFGGVGAMIDPPEVQVRISPCDQFSATGSLVERTTQNVELVSERWGLAALPACEIEVRSPPDHTGLGVGSQVSLAVAAGLRRFLRLTDLPIDSLAASVGRGKRSAVGTFGFRHGGLIVDAGKQPQGPLGKLARRVALPSEWRFVLVRPGNTRGLAGELEADAFAQLPPVPEAVTRELWQIADEQMLPAVEGADCAAFGEAVYRFGTLAGECFAAVQGGPFASPAVERLVASIRCFGIRGVGQSSWGPTVFAITANEAEAERLADWLRSRESGDCEITISRPNNAGATIDT